MNKLSIVLWLCVCAGLSACAGKPSPMPWIDPSEHAGTVKPIIVGTSRAPIEDELRRYGEDRSDVTSFHTVRVWIPEDRERGDIDYPSEDVDPDTEFAVTRISPLPEDRLVGAMNEGLAGFDGEERIVFIFVHGFNVPYSEGIYRAAQVAHDFKVTGSVVHYSWPSAGRLTRYLYDRDSVQFARDGLTDVLLAAGASDAETIFLMGHSMGALLSVEAVRQLSLMGRNDVLEKLSPMVLAAPDIDADVFRTQMAKINPKPDPFIVLVSRRDRALSFSDRLRGGYLRVGEGKNIDDLRALGVTVFDLSDLTDGDRINHATFASSGQLINMINDSDIVDTILSGGAENSQPGEDGVSLLSDLLSGIVFLPVRALDR